MASNAISSPTPEPSLSPPPHSSSNISNNSISLASAQSPTSTTSQTAAPATASAANTTNTNTTSAPSPSSTAMATATAVANHSQPPSNPTSRDAGVAKRYRAAPAKTFQCRGYGDCRMVFSRSEHLARHIRKHTGERPFSCHCGKQFSRLDNLRQHAQTVHADKADLNEQMMRELTALHTTMAAAHKAQNARGKRGQAAAAAAAAAAQQQQMVPTQQQGASGVVGPSGSSSALGAHPPVKAEEMHRSLSSTYGQQRPGTSVGYDVGPDQNGSAAFSGTRSWQLPTANVELEQSASQHASAQGRAIAPTAAHAAHHAPNSHSFRDPGQSFRVPPASSQHQQSSAHQQQQQSAPAPGQSFLASPASSFNISVANVRPTSSSSRPPTSSGNADAHARTLPPLAAVVSQSLSSPSYQPPVLPLPSTASAYGRSRRPATAPGLGSTSPAYYSQRYDYQRGSAGGGLGVISELPVHTSGRAAGLGGFSNYSEQLAGGSAGSAYDSARGRDYPPSPPGGAGNNDSPFSFHPPSITDAPTLPRKRRAGSSDASDDDVSAANTATRPPPTPSGGGGEYEYGSESRPQSRRLSLMELCNDPSPSDPPTTAGGTSRPFLPLSSSRPSTASGRYSASASSGPAGLASAVDAYAASASAAAAATATGTNRASPAPRNSGGVYASVQRADQHAQQQQQQFQYERQQYQPSSPLGGGSSSGARNVPDARPSPVSSTFSGGSGSPPHTHLTGSPSSGVPRRPAKSGRDSPADQVRVVPHSPAQSAASPAGVRV